MTARSMKRVLHVVRCYVAYVAIGCALVALTYFLYTDAVRRIFGWFALSIIPIISSLIINSTKWSINNMPKEK